MGSASGEGANFIFEVKLESEPITCELRRTDVCGDITTQLLHGPRRHWPRLGQFQKNPRALQLDTRLLVDLPLAPPTAYLPPMMELQSALIPKQFTDARKDAMTKRVVLATYRSLLKEARDIRRGDPLAIQALPFVAGGPQVVSTKTAHFDALETVLPPSAMPHARALPLGDLIGAMSGEDIFAIVRACFRAGAEETDARRIQALVNEGFLAIRTLGYHRSVQDRISVAVTNGIRVTAASQLVYPEPPSPVDSASMEWQDPMDSSPHRVQLRRVISALAGGPQQDNRAERSIFQYRIRIDNIGNNTVTVLGREWRIFNDDGSLHREIKRGTSESRMVVGLQPILEPGDSFIYYSGTDVKSSSGFMEGSFEVANGAVHYAEMMNAREAPEVEVYYARVAPFQLLSPPSD